MALFCQQHSKDLPSEEAPNASPYSIIKEENPKLVNKKEASIARGFFETKVG